MIILKTWIKNLKYFLFWTRYKLSLAKLRDFWTFYSKIIKEKLLKLRLRLIYWIIFDLNLIYTKFILRTVFKLLGFLFLLL